MFIYHHESSDYSFQVIARLLVNITQCLIMILMNSDPFNPPFLWIFLHKFEKNVKKLNKGLDLLPENDSLGPK